MSSQCDTGPLNKDIPAAMIAMIAAISMSAVNPCGNAAALEVTDDRTECEREEARWFARTYERIGDSRFNATERQHHATNQREPWNKGKLVGQKHPLKLKEIWAIRIRLQLANRSRDLAL